MRPYPFAHAPAAVFVCLLFGCGPSSGAIGEPPVDDDDVTDEPEEPTPGCNLADLNPLPVDYEVIGGIVTAEDFAFAADGSVISVDMNGNLVRNLPEGELQVISPNVGYETAGISILPGGDVVVADVSGGGLVRVDPSTGGKVTVLSGLAYPNGISVHRDGWVAVAEQDGGQVRRVDPDSGEFVVLASDLFNPNGVTFSPDWSVLYVGSFGGGTVHAIPLDADGASGPPELFGEMPDTGGDVPPWGWNPWGDACAGASSGDDCDILGEPGVCTDNIFGLECDSPTDPFEVACALTSEGGSCEVKGWPGICQDFGLDDLVCYGDWYSMGDAGIDGIGADICGNVYITNFAAATTNTYRFTGDSLDPEPLVDLPAEWLPNMEFGNGVGGWDTTKLYVSTRDNDSMFVLDIGVPGRPMASAP